MTTITKATLRALIAERFGGILHHGSHDPDGHACALEAWSQAMGRMWTDDPDVLQMPDLRPLNDGPWISDAARTAALVPVLVAVAPVWRDLARQRRWVERIVLDTIRQILPIALRQIGLNREAGACERARTLQEAEQAAGAVEETATNAAVRATGSAAAWAAAAGGAVAAMAVGKAASAAARAAAGLAKMVAVGSAEAGETVLVQACRLWVEAAQQT